VSTRQEETGSNGGVKGDGKEETVAAWVQQYQQYVGNSPPFSAEARDAFANICLGLCRAAGSVEAAVRALRVGHPGRAGPHLSPSAVEQALAGRMDEQRLHLLVQTLTEGACVRVQEDGFQWRKGVQCPPHKSAVDHEEELWASAWKDAMRGGAFILPRSGAEDLLASVEFSPLGRVDKRDHLGRIKPVGRLIHDISHGGTASVNARTDQSAAPGMVLPTVEHVVRTTLYWKWRYPGVPVMLTKRDVDSAFRRIPLEPAGVKYFGAVLGAWAVILLVLTFGWTSSPPIYALASVAISVLHRSYVPANPDRDGPEPFSSHTYLDDGMLVEPAMGRRLELSALCYEAAVELVLGPGAVSASKKSEEGEWATSAVILGLLVDTEAERMTLPWTKIERLKLLLSDAKWRRGCRHVTLKDVQELVGRLVHFTAVFPPARPFLSGLLRLLADKTREKTPAAAHVVPGVGQDSEDLAWEWWWDDLDWLRLLVDSVASWSVPCSSPFAVSLHPSEWELRGSGGRSVVYLGSDATQWSWSVFNWSRSEFARGYLTGKERERVRRDTRRRHRSERASVFRGSRRHRDALYIGVLELAAVVYGALKWGHEWKDCLVVAVTDSTNAVRWLRQGRARNGYAAHLLRVLSLLQLKYGFQLWSEWIASEENELPDCASRTWLESGELDEKEAARWCDLVRAWPRAPLVEVAVSDDERAASTWVDLSHPASRALSMASPSSLGLQGRLEASGRAGSLVLPVGGRSGARYGGGAPRVDRRDPAYPGQLTAARTSLFEDVMAPSTNRKYRSGFNHYRQFCGDTDRQSWLTGINPAEDEETLVLFAVDQGILQGLSPSTVAGKLAAVGWHHVRAGMPNPVKGKLQLRYAMKALRRRYGESQPKQPVTPDMLRAAGRALNLSVPRDKALWAGLLLGFGLLLRASEYLAHEESGEFESEKVIRWEDVTFRRDKQPVSFGDDLPPDEIVVRFRSSKTDQFKAGCLRNVFATGLPDLCPVLALWEWAKEVAVRKGPVMAVPGDEPVSREEVTERLRDAAVSLGDEPDNVGTHSLRAGGATALYAAGYGEKEITYQGRWASDSWVIYVHRTAARSVNVSKDMFSQRISLLRQARAPGGTRGLGEEGRGPTVPDKPAVTQCTATGTGGSQTQGKRKKSKPPINGVRVVASPASAAALSASVASPVAKRTGVQRLAAQGRARLRLAANKAPVCSLQRVFGCDIDG